MGDLLSLLEGVVPAEEIQRARRMESTEITRVEYLLSHQIIKPQELLPILSEHYQLPYVYLDHYHPDNNAITKLIEPVARRFSIFPLFQIDDELYLAVADPENLFAVDYVQQITGLSIELVLSTRQAIDDAINRYYLSSEQSARTLGEIVEPSHARREEGGVTEVKIEAEDAPVIKLVEHILSQGVHLAASDIIFDIFKDHSLLRYRLDGILHQFPPPPRDLYRAVVSRIKILSNLDIAEHRLPQDGRARIVVDAHNYDLRISIIPNLHGEGVVIRILDPGEKSRDLEQLGFSTPILAQLKKLIRKPYGMLLVTGPTGSGKTTTLYGVLKHIFTPQKHIITLEDPVEYQLDGITQIQINTEIDFTFARGLRSILRHDPDIIMLGEIRDLESAEIAIRSSLTGHLVLSTLHTNDAPSAVSRLVDMGIPSYMIFASLIGVLAQRLVRRLCSECKALRTVSTSELASLGLEALPEKKTQVYAPVGCVACSNLGYKGRVAIGELLAVTPEMRRLPSEKVTASALQDLAAKEGFVNLRSNAIEKLCSGITSLEEVLSLTMGQ